MYLICILMIFPHILGNTAVHGIGDCVPGLCIHMGCIDTSPYVWLTFPGCMLEVCTYMNCLEINQSEGANILGCILGQHTLVYSILCTQLFYIKLVHSKMLPCSRTHKIGFVKIAH